MADNVQYLMDAIVQQRDNALNSLAQAVAQLRAKDDEIEALKAQLPKRRKAKGAAR